MNRKIAIALVTIAAATGSAFAEDYDNYNPTTRTSGSRAEVQAELAQFKDAGINRSSKAYNPLREFQSTTSRQAVVAQYLASRNRVAALTGEDSGSAYLARTHSTADATTVAGQPRAAQ